MYITALQHVGCISVSAKVSDYIKTKKYCLGLDMIQKTSIHDCEFLKVQLNVQILIHLNYNAYNKNNGSMSFPLVLTAVIYLRLTGDEPTTLVTHLNIQDSKRQGLLLILSTQPGRQEAVAYCQSMQRDGVCYFSVSFNRKIIYNLEMTQGDIKGHHKSIFPQDCIS